MVRSWILLGLGTMLFAVAAANPERPALVRHGVPGAGRQVGDFLLEYDGRTRTGRWTLEYLDDPVRDAERDTERFRVDPEVPPEFRSSALDYRNTGYDIGHLAAAGNHLRSEAALQATFLMSNAAPQRPELNRGAWRQLEEWIRARPGPTWIVTCPLWLPDADGVIRVETIGRGVWVPTHFGKSVLHEGKLYAWILPNARCDLPLSEYAVSVDDLEAAAGLDLWPDLDEALQKRLERVCSPQP